MTAAPFRGARVHWATAIHRSPRPRTSVGLKMRKLASPPQTTYIGSRRRRCRRGRGSGGPSSSWRGRIVDSPLAYASPSRTRAADCPHSPWRRRRPGGKGGGIAFAARQRSLARRRLVGTAHAPRCPDAARATRTATARPPRAVRMDPRCSPLPAISYTLRRVHGRGRPCSRDPEESSGDGGPQRDVGDGQRATLLHASGPGIVASHLAVRAAVAPKPPMTRRVRRGCHRHLLPCHRSGACAWSTCQGRVARRVRWREW